ncbi:uncharacterized protein M421DRAFT_394993 [Didymella exigua CBS 183.55]|uniref:Uncharacterized protein n=1 Tax=Didymella exigua CBS 183.55 TaxID=1150837 RepID=A0A6A5RJB0_9PLEO|nr:uncharacterized protein M421DRAFT_394993 [Didymella exigua CBS 183.55]KAF1927054.1 hypothetical protein M421DRAFT_394993 [Didymella exigua CBS 183.55]
MTSSAPLLVRIVSRRSIRTHAIEYQTVIKRLKLVSRGKHFSLVHALDCGRSTAKILGAIAHTPMHIDATPFWATYLTFSGTTKTSNSFHTHANSQSLPSIPKTAPSIKTRAPANAATSFQKTQPRRAGRQRTNRRISVRHRQVRRRRARQAWKAESDEITEPGDWGG